VGNSLEPEAGIEWPELLNELTQRQNEHESRLGILLRIEQRLDALLSLSICFDTRDTIAQKQKATNY
jgi:hypothetical protein